MRVFSLYTCTSCLATHDIASQLTKKHVSLLVIFLARSKISCFQGINSANIFSVRERLEYFDHVLDVVTINILEIDLATHMEWVINTNCQLLNSKE